MAKITELVNDFSGGIVKGYASSNLKNNQLAECNNLIADGIGKLTTVPAVQTKSTNDFVVDLPSIKSKNIHAWSTDMHLSILTPQDSSVIVDPVVTEVQTAIQARTIFFTTNMKANLQGTVGIYDDDNDMVLDVIFFDGTIGGGKSESFVREQETVKQLEEHINAWNTRTHDGSGSSFDEVFDTYNNEISEWNYMTHSQMGAFQKGFPQNFNSSTYFPISFDTSAQQWRNLNVDDTATARFGNPYLSAFVGQEAFTADDDDTGRVLRFGIIHEYWGRKNIKLIPVQGSMSSPEHWTAKRHPSVGFGEFGLTGTPTEEMLTFPLSNEILTANMMGESDGNMINRIGNVDGWEDNDEEWIMYWSDVYDEYKQFGAFSKWTYELQNVPNNQNVNYKLTIVFHSNSDHSEEKTLQASFEHEIGQDAYDIRTGLFSALEAKLNNDDELSPFKFSWVDDGEKITFEQDVNTPKPYGIKSVTAQQTVRQDNIELTTGQAFDNLLAVAGENAQVAVYRIDDDEWNDWNLDLRNDTSVSQNTALAFSDAEGYLRVSDKNFYTNNKPKWFGYLDLNNHVYVDGNFNVDDQGNPQGGFYEDDVMPTPYTKIHDDEGSLLEGQWTHTAYEVYNNFQYDEDSPSEITLDVPQHADFSPHQQGIKVFAEWMDGKDSDGNNESGLDAYKGAFGKEENLEIWWNYIYVGGAISQPQKFKSWNGTSIGEFSMTPKVADEDKVALGLSISLGRRLVSGDGSTGLINARLKGVEIWGRFTNYDANNLVQLAEIDLAKGWMSEATGDWQPLHDHQYVDSESVSHPNAWYTQYDGTFSLAETLIYTSPPAITFFHKYGIRHDVPIGFGTLGSGWKTSCVFNRRAYYGNVRLENTDNLLTYYPDGIVKSAVGMYDTVSVDNLIEATINDGDEITCLIVAGNKLLQFKKRSLTIMGVKILENGQSREVIERTIDHVGVDGDNQICKTPYGILWISRSGIYTYDGQKLEKLTENQQGSTISKRVWETFYNERTHVGYDAYWNQVHICQDVVNNPKTLIYSFNTKAFTETDKMYSSDQKTGFVNDASGHLLWAQIGTGANSLTGNSNNRPSFKDRNNRYNAQEAPTETQDDDVSIN